MAPIRRKLVASIAAIALLLQNVGGFLAVDRPRRDDGCSSSMKLSVQTTANGFSHHGRRQLPPCVNPRQWSPIDNAAFARHQHRERVSFTQTGAGNANPSSQEGGGAADRTTRVREMAAFVTASLTQALVSRMDPTKEVSPQEQRALADLLGAVLTPPSPTTAAPTESSEAYPSASSLEHDGSSEKAPAPDPAVTVTPREISVEAEAAVVDQRKDFEDQSTDFLVVDEKIVKAPPKVVASEATIIAYDEAGPPKTRLEAALKKALETGENLVEDIPTTTSPTSTADPDEAVSILEKAESLHKKEGDRMVALKDQFATEEVATEAGGAGGAAHGEIASMSTEVESRNRVDEDEEPLPFLSNKGEAATTANAERTTTTAMGEDHAGVSISTTDGSLRKVDTVQNLVPPIPEAISTAFGRPLPVVIQDVPPLKSLPELATTEEKTAAATANSNSNSAAGASSNEENAETANKATVAAATAGASKLSSWLAAEQEKVVKDEDAYGE